MSMPDCPGPRLALSFFGSLLRLYPADFYQEFGEEMHQVFCDRLVAASAAARLAWLWILLRELVDLPASLLREHRRSGFQREGKMETGIHKKQAGTSPEPGWGKPAATWGEAFLAGLPFLLVLLFTSLMLVPQLLHMDPEQTSLDNVLNTLAVILLIVTSIVVFGIAWRLKWPLWSSSWMAVGLVLVFYPLMLVLSFVVDRFRLENSTDFVVFTVLPLVLAYVLYRFTRADRLRGLLAAQLPLIVLWGSNLEFVPDSIELVIRATSLLMMALAAVLAVRIGDWKLALWLFLATNFAVGFEYAYVGIYHGGALPFSAAGPSLGEVVKNFIPAYLATSTLFLGPLLARRFREIGLRSGERGSVAYRLVLAGLLLLLATNLAGITLGTNNSYLSGIVTSSSILNGFLLLGYALFGVGLALLYRAARQHSALPDGIETLLLAVLPLGLPLVLVMPVVLGSIRPINQVYGIPAMFYLPRLATMIAGIAWLLLTTWLVSRDEKPPQTVPVLVPQPGPSEI